MHRQTAHQMLKKAFIAAGLNGKIATHSLRKSFAQRVYGQNRGEVWLVDLGRVAKVRPCLVIFF